MSFWIVTIFVFFLLLSGMRRGPGGGFTNDWFPDVGDDGDGSSDGGSDGGGCGGGGCGGGGD